MPFIFSLKAYISKTNSMTPILLLLEIDQQDNIKVCAKFKISSGADLEPR